MYTYIYILYILASKAMMGSGDFQYVRLAFLGSQVWWKRSNLPMTFQTLCARC